MESNFNVHAFYRQRDLSIWGHLGAIYPQYLCSYLFQGRARTKF